MQKNWNPSRHSSLIVARSLLKQLNGDRIRHRRDSLWLAEVK